MRWWGPLVAALVAVAAACSGNSQTFAEAVQIICSAPDSDEAQHASPAERMEVISRWVDQRVTHSKARALYAGLGEMAPEQRAKALTDAADEARVTPCKLAIELAPVAPDDDGAAAPPADAPSDTGAEGSPPPPDDSLNDPGKIERPPPPQPARSRLTLGDVTTSGSSSLDSAAIAKTIRQRYTVMLRRCYERRLDEQPELRGRIAAEVTVGTAGRVVSVTMKTFDDAVDACAERLIGAWRFEVPRDANGEPTTQRFTFSAAVEPAS